MKNNKKHYRARVQKINTGLFKVYQLVYLLYSRSNNSMKNSKNRYRVEAIKNQSEFFYGIPTGILFILWEW